MLGRWSVRARCSSVRHGVHLNLLESEILAKVAASAGRARRAPATELPGPALPKSPLCCHRRGGFACLGMAAAALGLVISVLKP
jgi:hypothetical protein